VTEPASTAATKTATKPPRPPAIRSDKGHAAMEAALAPVADTLVAAAHARAQAERSLAEEDALSELASSRAEAERLLTEARAEGIQAARQEAAARLAVARREARELVLAARRRAYERLRSDAVEALEQRGATPEGRLLGTRLMALVRDRIGTTAAVRQVGPGSLAAVAESGNRRAALGASALVDQTLMSMADKIEGLWA
jgi:vacuolar-type H+-ATPase subunit E/Vma4